MTLGSTTHSGEHISSNWQRRSSLKRRNRKTAFSLAVHIHLFPAAPAHRSTDFRLIHPLTRMEPTFPWARYVSIFLENYGSIDHFCGEQRSLVSLARALVVDAKINILDEATASVDYETDHKIQMTIARWVLSVRSNGLGLTCCVSRFREFKDRTILCIARKCLTDCGVPGS